jgi:hypothetical protein
VGTRLEGGRARRYPMHGNKLEEPVPNGPEGRTWAELIAEAQVRDRVRGNVQAALPIAPKGEHVKPSSLKIKTMTQAFERMTSEEWEAYARNGILPIWFPQTSTRTPTDIGDRETNPSDFPLGSIESRAMARAQIERTEQPKALLRVRIIYIGRDGKELLPSPRRIPREGGATEIIHVAGSSS